MSKSTGAVTQEESAPMSKMSTNIFKLLFPSLLIVEKEIGGNSHQKFTYICTTMIKNMKI
jgi:hypothetical protein